jgi:outer membrane protein OmpA-like peptidoglycan-associated protein
VRGSELYNQLLAEKRAKSTVQCLGELGIDKDRILIKILGDSHPLKQLEKQSETRWHKLNRRVDIELNEITME